MGISLYNIKKWFNMLSGNSVHHVNQDIGKLYSKDKVAGYYNDLTEKITRFGTPNGEIPKSKVNSGEEIYFSISVFQYGLASYDLYLTNSDEEMLSVMIKCANWALDNQQKDGSWRTFDYKTPDKPYSSMAQGEAISLLIRAHIATGDDKYLKAAVSAKDFMLLSLSDGGTTGYDGEDVYFFEHTGMSPVLNGWIFSLWGLYDYCKYVNDADAQKILEATLITLKKSLLAYDTGYWSKYDKEKRIASPFYHNLHIAQLKVMYDLFDDEIYLEYAKKWERYSKSFIKPKLAFIKKAVQKIFE